MTRSGSSSSIAARYRAAIEEEDPDLVIGDVFSLDLALPHVMRREGNPAAPSKLILRRHPHTPRWVLDTRAGGAIDVVVDDVAELLGLVRGPAGPDCSAPQQTGDPIAP